MKHLLLVIGTFAIFGLGNLGCDSGEGGGGERGGDGPAG